MFQRYKGKTEREINRRLVSTKRAIAAFKLCAVEQTIIINRKKIIHNTIVESTLFYGAVTWTITKENEKKLLTTEMDFWRLLAIIFRLERKINNTVPNLLNVATNLIKKIDEKKCK